MSPSQTPELTVSQFGLIYVRVTLVMTATVFIYLFYICSLGWQCDFDQSVGMGQILWKLSRYCLIAGSVLALPYFSFTLLTLTLTLPTYLLRLSAFLGPPTIYHLWSLASGQAGSEMVFRFSAYLALALGGVISLNLTLGLIHPRRSKR